jgi:hypothetical protein
MMKSHLFGFALLSVTAIVASAPAQAQNGSLTRSFVSSAGVDTNACTITAPCASFAQAYTKISANGIIAALDPGKYGPLNIVGGITINGNGWAAITAPAAGVGIAINAGTGNVILTGLEIDGTNAAYNGIVFNSGSSLTVTNCTLRNYVYDGSHPSTGNGIVMAPTTGTLDFTITNTTAANNGTSGITYAPSSGSPSANGVIDHVVANSNGSYGILITTDATSGGTTIVSVSNSIASGNGNDGIFVDNSTSLSTNKVLIDNLYASANNTGVEVSGTANVLLGRSIISANTLIGVSDNTSPNTLYTSGDNRIDLNASASITPIGTQLVPAPPQ